MNEMDIQPKISKKQYFIAAGIIVFLLIATFLFFALNISKQDSNASESTKTALSFITNTIDADFLDPFKHKKTKIETPKPETKEVAKVEPKPKLKETDEAEFNELFNRYEITRTTKNKARAFLNKANQSGKIRTFKPFAKSTTEKTTKKQIDTGYQQLGVAKTNASYPIDFSRTLTVDRRIDAILIEDVDSTLGGKVTAQIENNVYAAQDRNILIPIGSKAIGYYQPLNKIGENRLKIVWSRIITPKGVNIVMNSEMTDAMGRSGITGEIDTKFWDKYGLALLVSTVSAVAQATANISVDQNKAIFINTYGKELSNLSAKILEEQINIKPIVRIAAGSRILISPTQDIWFRNSQGIVEVRPNTQRIITQEGDNHEKNAIN